MNHNIYIPDISLSINPNQIIFKNEILSGLINNINDISQVSSIPISLDQRLDESLIYYLRLGLDYFSGKISFFEIIDEQKVIEIKKERGDDIFLPLWKKADPNIYFFGIPNFTFEKDNSQFSIRPSPISQNQVITGPVIPNSSNVSISRQFINKITGELKNGEGLFAKMIIIRQENEEGNEFFYIEDFQLINKSKLEAYIDLGNNPSESAFPIAYKQDGKIKITIWDGITIRKVNSLSGGVTTIIS